MSRPKKSNHYNPYSFHDQDDELDITTLKYVMYVRKSSEEKQRQLRSIPDQIAECKILQKRLNLNVVDILKEEKSAKLPNKRPVFTQMIKKLRDGTYNAILAWHPDRLARNMLEGGALIDMVDQKIIKDLKFVTHHFTSDANGKMLLGMAFVLSKQYSDKLSQDVTRGVRRSHKRGKTPAGKHGYIRDDEGIYRPDPRTHSLIVEAWKQRADGKSQASIFKYLKSHGYYRMTKGSPEKKKPPRKIKISKQIVSTIFKDPFYYGMLVQAGKATDLREIYDFKPAVDENTFNAIQYASRRQKKPYKSRGAFLPLKNMVFCGCCDHQMYAGTSRSGSGKRYLTYSCRNSNCIVHSKENKKKHRSDDSKIPTSVRAKVIFDFIYDLLDEGFNFTEQEYKTYLENLTQLSNEQLEKNRMEIVSLEGQRKHLIAEKRRLGLALPTLDANTDIYEINKQEYERVLHDYNVIQAEITKLKDKIGNSEKETLNREQFFKLSKNASKSIKAGDAHQKDAICRFIFSNLIVKNKKVTSYQLKEPFATLLKNRNVLSCRGDRT